MKAFRFALQPVLDERVRVEGELRAALAAAVRATAAEHARAGRLRSELGRVGDMLRLAASASSSAGVAQAAATIELLGSALRQCEALALRAAALEAQARAMYAAAHVERRRIEALRDRAYVAHSIAFEQREALALEDTNAAAHNSATFPAPSFHI